MTLLLVLATAAAGYLVGSISFARVVGRMAAPGADLLETTLVYGGDGTPVPAGGVSATSVGAKVGGRWALVVVVLDMAKAALPALVAGWVAPGTIAPLVAAGAAVAGHVWPVWHGFVGGFGISPIIGSLLVIDARVIPVTILAAGLVGLLVADRLIAYDGWTLLLPPWFLWQGAPATALWAVVVVAIYWWAMRAEVVDHLRRVRRGGRTRSERWADIRSGYTGQPTEGPPGS